MMSYLNAYIADLKILLKSPDSTVGNAVMPK